MKDRLVRGSGEAEVPEPTELSRPLPAPGEVTVRVRATSVDPADGTVRRSVPRITPPRPRER